jgi:hypothetical protein
MSNLLSNTAAIISSVITSPNETTVIGTPATIEKPSKAPEPELDLSWLEDLGEVSPEIHVEGLFPYKTKKSIIKKDAEGPRPMWVPENWKPVQEPQITIAPIEQPAPKTPVAGQITLNPAFKLVFLSILAITILSGIGEIALAIQWPTPTANQQSAFDAVGFAWKAGVGAIFGLLGGKVT